MTGQPQTLSQSDQSSPESPTRVLVVYYSRTGLTRTVAEAIVQHLACDLEEIVDTKSRRGPWGYVIAGMEAVRKKLTRIERIRHNPADYDLVAVGGPVWGGTMAPAVRTYLTQRTAEIPKVAFFCTQGGHGPAHTFTHMQELCSKAPVAKLSLRAKLVKAGAVSEEVRAFAEQLRSAASAAEG